MLDHMKILFAVKHLDKALRDYFAEIGKKAAVRAVSVDALQIGRLSDSGTLPRGIAAS